MTKIKELSQLPNKIGFEFIGIGKDNQKYDCNVYYDNVKNIHRIGGQANYNQLKGWTNK
jgi:hypothetical protein